MRQKIISLKKYMCKILNYINHLFTLATTLTGCMSLSAFECLAGISLGIASSAVGIKILKKTAIIGNCKSIIRKQKHDKIILLTILLQ